MAKIPDIPIPLREKIRKYHKKIGQEKFYSRLLKLDPKVKNFILKSDNQRSIRAYEVNKFTKKSLYDWTENTKMKYNFTEFCGLTKEEQIRLGTIHLNEELSGTVKKKKMKQLEDMLKKKVV